MCIGISPLDFIGYALTKAQMDKLTPEEHTALANGDWAQVPGWAGGYKEDLADPDPTKMHKDPTPTSFVDFIPGGSLLRDTFWGTEDEANGGN